MFPPVPRNVWLRNIPPLYFAFSNLLVDFCFVLKKKKKDCGCFIQSLEDTFFIEFSLLWYLFVTCVLLNSLPWKISHRFPRWQICCSCATFGFFVFLCSCYASQTRLTDKSRNDTDGPTASFSYPARRFIYSNDRRRRRRHRALLRTEKKVRLH